MKSLKRSIPTTETFQQEVPSLFYQVVQAEQFETGVIVGISSEEASKKISAVSTLKNLYKVDPYKDAVDQLDLPEYVDFVYIENEPSYESLWSHLCTWYVIVREGGIIGGSHYRQDNFPGVTQAVDEFFRRFEWRVHVEDQGRWWVRKQPLNISFLMPAYNCASTIQESVESIMLENFSRGDELVIVDDGSTDNTVAIVEELQTKYPQIHLIKHSRNKGGSAARNTAIEQCRHPLLFNLDSDNILAPGSIPQLKRFLESTGADVAYFREDRFFIGNRQNVTHTWQYPGEVNLADCLAGINPGDSGNYMFTKESWLRAGGYLEIPGALYDTWAFGFRQLATGSKMRGMPDSFYYHRHGHNSYWRRDTKGKKRSLPISLRATQILIPFLDLLDERDIDYIMGPEGRYTWFARLRQRPLRLRSGLTRQHEGWNIEGKHGLFVFKLIRKLKLMLQYPTLSKWLKNRLVSVQIAGAILGIMAVIWGFLCFRNWNGRSSNE